MLPVDIRERIDLKMQAAEQDAQTWIRTTFAAEIKEPSFAIGMKRDHALV